jgi:small subunit ribosomal protein S9
MPTTAKTKKKEGQYYEGIGRRKEALARVRVHFGKKTHITVNDRKYTDFFTTMDLQHTVLDALMTAGGVEAEITAKVSGGGMRAQAEAVRLGIARALIDYDIAHRPALKQAGFLRRDARVVERKKFGLRKARRAPQWSKR